MAIAVQVLFVVSVEQDIGFKVVDSCVSFYVGGLPCGISTANQTHRIVPGRPFWDFC